MEPLSPERQKLAESAVPTAASIARRYAAMFPEHASEIESSAYFGAVRAASEYDDDKAAWDYWAKLKIRGEIREYLRSGQARQARRLRLDDEGMGSAEDDHDSHAEVEARDRFDRLLQTLPARHREVCRLVYVLGHSPAEAGRMLGLSTYRGCTLHREALAILRREDAA